MQLLEEAVKMQERVSREREDPGRSAKSLMVAFPATRFSSRGAIEQAFQEEMEEKELLWSSDKSPLHFAAVHNSGTSKTVPLSLDSRLSLTLSGSNQSLNWRPEHPLTSPFVRKTPGDLFGETMHITVNAFEDPEELVLDEAAAASKTRFTRLRAALQARIAASGYRPHQVNPFPSYPCSASAPRPPVLQAGWGGGSSDFRHPSRAQSAVCCSLM